METAASFLPGENDAIRKVNGARPGAVKVQMNVRESRLDCLCGRRGGREHRRPQDSDRTIVTFLPFYSSSAKHYTTAVLRAARNIVALQFSSSLPFCATANAFFDLPPRRATRGSFLHSKRRIPKHFSAGNIQTRKGIVKISGQTGTETLKLFSSRLSTQ